MSRALKCSIRSPGGDELDVSPLLDVGGMSTITFEPEQDLGVIAHGDMQLALQDIGGAASGFLSGAAAGDIYEVIFERERIDGSWERLFGGILDPISVSYDKKTLVLTVDAWSYSKLLERTPANTIKRALATKTASINSGSRVLSFLANSSETSDIVAGDSVRLTDAQGNSGDFIIDSITSATQALTTEPASANLTNCIAVVTTPYYRDKTPAQLAALIAAALAMDLDGSDFALDLASYPIVTPLVIAGGSSAAQPASLVPRGTTLVATFDVADSANRKVCASPSTPWAVGLLTNSFQADWTPYLTAEPGTIQERATGPDMITADWNAQGPYSGARYVAECVAYTAGVDTAVGDRWQLHTDRTFVSPNNFDRLLLYKNGSQVAVLESANVGATPPAFATYHAWIEWDTVNNVPWISWQLVMPGATDPTIRKLGWWQGTGANVFHAVSTAKSGQLRFSRGLGAGHLLFYDCPISLATGSAPTGTLETRDATDAFVLTGLGVDHSIPFGLGYPLLWTARAWNGYLVFQFQQGETVRLAMYETGTFGFVAAYTIASEIKSFRCYLTLFALADGRTIIAGYAGGEWFVLSLRYDGVIRYANFDGKSCAAALAQVALITNSIVNVDEFKTLKLANRRGLGRGEPIGTLDFVLEEDVFAISELYRSSVEVKGTLDTGGSIAVIVGDEGDSARRLSLSAELVTTSGMAVATAIATYQFFAAIGGQRDLTARDDGDALKFGDVVLRNDKKHVVYKGERDLEQQIQHLTLLEVIQ